MKKIIAAGVLGIITFNGLAMIIYLILK